MNDDSRTVPFGVRVVMLAVLLVILGAFVVAGILISGGGAARARADEASAPRQAPHGV